jgi:hypothetical protein
MIPDYSGLDPGQMVQGALELADQVAQRGLTELKDRLMCLLSRVRRLLR